MADCLKFISDWWILLLLWVLFMAVLAGGFYSLRLTIQFHTDHVRESFRSQYDVLEAKLAQIHSLTNSNLTAVQAELEQANLKIQSLQASIVKLAEARRRAEDRRE